MNPNRRAKLEWRRLRAMKGKRRVERRAARLRRLDPDIQWRVARLAAGGTLDDE